MRLARRPQRPTTVPSDPRALQAAAQRWGPFRTTNAKRAPVFSGTRLGWRAFGSSHIWPSWQDSLATSYSPTQIPHAVPSAPKSLTSEFGMGSGMASSIKSPEVWASRPLLPPTFVGDSTASFRSSVTRASSQCLLGTAYRRPTPGVSLNVCLSGYGQAARPISTG